MRKEVESIAQMMEMEQSGNKKDYEVFKRNFDTIINAKAVEMK